MFLLKLLLIVILIIILSVWYIKKQYSFWKNLNIPYVQPQFPYGNLNGVGNKVHIMDRLKIYYNQYKKQCIPFIGIYFFIRPAALIIDQNLLKNIFIKDAHNFNDRGNYYNEKYDPLSAHLFSIHGPKWRLLRSKLTPTFTGGKMKYMFLTVVDVMKRLEDKLIDEVNQNQHSNKNNVLEIRDILARYTTDVIGTCAFGIECNTLQAKNAEFRQMGLKIFDNSKFGFVMSLFLLSIRNLAQKLRIRRLHKDLSDFFYNIVKETVEYRELNQIKRHDFLNLLMELKENTKNNQNQQTSITMNEIAAQAFVFFAAGFETSSTLLTFCIYELAANPHIQIKTRQHIEDILKKHNNELTYEAMMDMKYLDQILNETLRLYSPLTMLLRIADNDYVVPDSNFIIKKNTIAVIPVQAIHYDAEFYPNPTQFNPNNFTEENIQNRPSTSFLPFGEGPRNCIGSRFGMMQARLGLIGVLRKFKFSLSSPTQYPVEILKDNFITTPKGGMPLKVEYL